MIRRILNLLLILAFAGCTASYVTTPLPPTQTQIAKDALTLWEQPSALPSVIRGLSVTTLVETHSARQLCVDLNEYEIWEPGDYGSDVYFNIQRTTQIEINQIPVPHNNLSISGLAILLSRRDQAGNVVGSHGGGTSVCFSVVDLANGLYFASISFQSTSGAEYKYEWAFRVLRTDDKMMLELPI